MRAVGLDLGSKRIGVALSDSGGSLALPYETLHRSGDRRTDHARIADLVDELGAEVVVVGMPRSLDGSEGPAARRTRTEVRQLADLLHVEVETYDERFTTVSASRMLRQAGVSGERQRKVVDASAAAVMLQAWLDRRLRVASEDGDRTTDG